MQVINKTGFMSGLYTTAEMNSDNIKVHYAQFVNFHNFIGIVENCMSNKDIQLST